MKKIIMLKLGGAVLTDKSIPCKIREDLIDSMTGQIYKYLHGPSVRLVIGNGGGSFGHYYAQKYALTDGIKNAAGLYGMCRGKNGNAYLNTRLVKSLTERGINACTYPVEDVFYVHSESGQSNEYSAWERLIAYLDFGMVPVVYGDILFDKSRGCRIVSTENIFGALEKAVSGRPEWDYEIEKIIFCTDRDGVEDLTGRVIKTIDRKSFNQWEVFRTDSQCFDVTGGMYGKVKLALEDVSCPVQIINGSCPESIYQALLGKKTEGTLICG